MSDLLSIGASGVLAYQTALTTVSDNIANTGVAGYSRRQVQRQRCYGGQRRRGGRRRPRGGRN